ncbi:MAG: V-type ATP synthase subunit F [Brevinematia bacterium]
MKVVGLFDKYTSEVFRFLGVESFSLSPEDPNLSAKIIDYLEEFKKNKNIFSILISKNLSSKVRKELEEFALNNTRPTVVEVDPMYNVEEYEDYEAIIKRIVRETIGIRL